MFYDLNVPYSPDDPEAPHTLNFLAERKSFSRGRHKIGACWIVTT
jgi:hypothetical protein